MVWQGEARQGEDSFELVVVPRFAAGQGVAGHGGAGRGEDSFELVVVPRFAARRGEAGHGAARQGMAGRGLF